MEKDRYDATKLENVAEHIARVRGAVNRYIIKRALYTVNLDESGDSFERLNGRSICKLIAPTFKHDVCAVWRTKGMLGYVKVMFVVNAAGQIFKSVNVYAGLQTHFRLNERSQ